MKYHLLLPSVSHVGTTLDTNHWESILRSVEANNSYRWVYGVQYKPLNIADYLILNGRMPRSLRYCYGRVMSSLNLLVKEHGAAHSCHDSAAQTLTTLSDSTIERIFKTGLHEFLTGFIRRNQRLGLEIAQAYNFD